MLDRPLKLEHRVNKVLQDPPGTVGVWGERLERVAAGERRDRVEYRLRWSADWFERIVQGTATHDQEIRLIDGDLTFVIDRAEEESRRRFMVVQAWRIA